MKPWKQDALEWLVMLLLLLLLFLWLLFWLRPEPSVDLEKIKATWPTTNSDGKPVVGEAGP